jgi:hypothetical protein
MKIKILLTIIVLLIAVNTASAATTVSTDISTGGIITSSGVATSSFVGALGIGTTSPSYKLSVGGDTNITDMLGIGHSIETYSGYLASNNIGVYINNLVSNTDNNAQTGDGFGLVAYSTMDSNTGAQYGRMYGADIRPAVTGSEDIEGLVAITAVPYVNNFSGNITSIIAGDFYNYNGPGLITNTYGIKTSSGFYNTGYTTNRYGISIGEPFGPHKDRLANNYGLYIADQSGSGATSTYNIYSAGSSAKNIFEGKIGIGTTTPATKLHVSSGASATTTVSIGELGLSSSKACVNMNRPNGGAASFYINNAGTMVVETTYCR